MCRHFIAFNCVCWSLSIISWWLLFWSSLWGMDAGALTKTLFPLWLSIFPLPALPLGPWKNRSHLCSMSFIDPYLMPFYGEKTEHQGASPVLASFLYYCSKSVKPWLLISVWLIFLTDHLNSCQLNTRVMKFWFYFLLAKYKYHWKIKWN